MKIFAPHVRRSIDPPKQPRSFRVDVTTADGLRKALQTRGGGEFPVQTRGGGEFPVRLHGTEELIEFRAGNNLAQSNTLFTAGGALIAEGFAESVEYGLLFASSIRRLATVTRIEGKMAPWQLPTINDTSVNGQILNDNQVASVADTTFGLVSLVPHKYSSRRLVLSNELLADASEAFVASLGRLIGERIGRAQNYFWTVGTGGNQPVGIVAAAPVGATAQSQTAIAYNDLQSLIYAVDPAYRENAYFMMSDQVQGLVRKITDSQGRPIFTQTHQGPLVIDGFPVMPNNSMATTLASGVKSVLFGDFSKVEILDVRDLSINTYDEATYGPSTTGYAENDQRALQGILRSAAQLADPGTGPVKALQH